MNNLHSPKNGKNGIFGTYRSSKIDFTQILSHRKTMKFPHCVAVANSRVYTDLGSLIENTHNMWISGFLCHSDFTWNQFWSFWRSQKLSFWPFEQLWTLNFWEILTFSRVKYNFQKSKFKASKIVKMVVFHLMKISS